MSTGTSGLQATVDLALKEGIRAGCSDVSIIGSRSLTSQVRFSNNSITLVNSVRNITIDFYLAKNRRRILGSSSNPTERGVRSFVQRLVSACESLPESKDYAPLPSGPFHYQKRGNYDPKVADAPLVDYVNEAIESALRSGALRVSGSLNTESTQSIISTSAGANADDKVSMMLLNVRAFADDNASGHGLSCTSFISDFRAGEAGRRAGEYAKMSLHPVQLEQGKYDVIFLSTVVANILPVAGAASAFAIQTGMSYLADKLGQRVGVESLGVMDQAVPERGLGGRSFDDEGTPTQDNDVISRGTFSTILHNTTTAKKFSAKSTGNAGIIVPRPNTVVFEKGGVTFDEMIKDTRNGVLITNNWYTRYQNQRTGEYSTVPRDAAFKIKDGAIAEPLFGLRVSDSIPRQLSSIEAISTEREWIKWWEVDTPTFAPAMKISGVPITRAVGS